LVLAAGTANIAQGVLDGPVIGRSHRRGDLVQAAGASPNAVLPATDERPSGFTHVLGDAGFPHRGFPGHLSASQTRYRVPGG